MNTPLLALAAVALCLSLSSCEVLSKNPLSSPVQAAPDTRLIGDWHGRLSANDGTATYRFTSTRNGWMHLNVLPDKAGEPINSYEFFVSTIGQDHFLNMVMPGTSVPWYTASDYSFVRYQLTAGPTLRLWQMSQDQAAAAVRAGKIKGAVHQDKNPLMTGHPPRPEVDVLLTDSVFNLNRFIQESNLDALFDQPMPLLHRVNSVR